MTVQGPLIRLFSTVPLGLVLTVHLVRLRLTMSWPWADESLQVAERMSVRAHARGDVGSDFQRQFPTCCAPNCMINQTQAIKK